MEELSDEDVRLYDGFHVSLLYAFQDVNKPLEMLLAGRHPYEVQLENISSSLYKYYRHTEHNAKYERKVTDLWNMVL